MSCYLDKLVLLTWIALALLPMCAWLIYTGMLIERYNARAKQAKSEATR